MSAADSSSTSPTTRTPTGPTVIATIAKRLPNRPGVYRMIDVDGTVLYVGKARSLKKRVQSYTRLAGLPSRILKVINATASMEFVTTRTETEALLLEANLIKRLRPRFNVLLRDDKSFPYILLTGDHAAPRIAKHRGARSRKGQYFGPFASAGAVGRTINALERAFLLRTCSDAVYDSRTRPCLLFQIKRCAAPCTGEISLADYSALTREAGAFLSGRGKVVRAAMQQAMEAAAERLDFESAARYRDRLAALAHVLAHQGINPGSVQEADVFACHQEGGRTCVEVFFFRTGQNWGNRAYFPRAEASLEPAEVLGTFLAQFYDDKPPPKLLLLSHDFPERGLLSAALSERAGRKVAVSVPQRGEKLALVEQAARNAREALGRSLAESSSQARLIGGFAEAFDLGEPPARIEVYDNSHIMGTNAVGAMIVSGPEGLSKAHYRKFNIKSETLTPGDDYGMMREVLRRRFTRLMREAGPREEAQSKQDGADDEPATLADIGPWPDVVLIDGGRGQLSAAQGVFEELGITDLPLIGIAKGPDRDAGRETFHMHGRPPFTIAPRDPVLYFIQRLRDEAHRFAIGSHRARRKADLTRNPLDEIAGIGPARKRALLKHFGTAKAVSRADIADLTVVDGISDETARTIYDHFHDGPS
ncbi:MAG: excinuclease ABC subunit UvrC [Alphaproteobacteria bacterium]